jgi:hypothetical protein
MNPILARSLGLHHLWRQHDPEHDQGQHQHQRSHQSAQGYLSFTALVSNENGWQAFGGQTVALEYSIMSD